jgi:DNA repair exonuclease SbcCD ATPase subunit
MAESKPHRPAPHNGTTPYHRGPVSSAHGLNGHGSSRDTARPAATEEAYGSDALLLEEMPRPGEERGDDLSLLEAGSPVQVPVAEGEDVEKLQAENAELRSIIAELNQQMQSAADSARLAWIEREKEYDSMLEEKSELIRSLHLKMQEVQEGSAPADGRPQNEEEFQQVYDELERERTQLDQERRQMNEDRAQLQADEEALMKQMREMEMSMSRERAELARQRNELQRLHTDIKHELELAERDASLRDRLAPLQRRHQDISNRKGAAPAPEKRPAPAAAPAAAPAPAAGPARKKESGLFRRLFGSGR